MKNGREELMMEKKDLSIRVGRQDRFKDLGNGGAALCMGLPSSQTSLLAALG